MKKDSVFLVLLVFYAYAMVAGELTKEICNLQIMKSQIKIASVPSKEEWVKMVDNRKPYGCQISSESEPDNKLESSIYEQEMKLRESVSRMSPSEVIPEMYKLLESRCFETDANFKPYYLKQEGEKITRKLFRPYGIIHSFIYEHKHICIDIGSPCFYWLSGSGNVLMSEDFWWYEGRKYMPQIWDQWYTSWKIEMAGENVRTSVVHSLAHEMSNLGMYILPYINEAIKAGDKTLDPLIQKINCNSSVKLCVPFTADFLAWFATNSWKYALPPCEGLENARKRLATSNPDYVKELSGVVLTNAAGDDISHLGNEWKEYFPRLEKSMAEYYANPSLVPKHWYYQLPDGMECSAWNPNDHSSTATNVNFKAIEALKMMKRVRQ